MSTTPLLAQEAGTDPLAPTPPIETPAEEPAASTPSTEPVAATPAPVEERAAGPVATAGPATTRPRAAARTAAPAAARAVSAEPGEIGPLPSESAAQPAVAAPAPVAAPPALPSQPAAADTDTMVETDEGAMWAAAGALALFGVAGAALVGRRRRNSLAAEPAAASWSEPPRAKTVRSGGFVTTASPHAGRPVRPAFAWRGQPAQPAAAPVAEGDRIAAAYRGPTPDNPSLSLKKRLKRAAFFDQRDRAVRAGKAAPVSPHAGLPRRLAENVRTAMRPAVSHGRPALQPA